MTRRDTRYDSASSLCEDPQKMVRKMTLTAIEKLLCKIPAKGYLYQVSTQKIFVRDLKVRSLFKLSIYDLRARPLLSSPGLATGSPKEVSSPDLCTRSLVSWQDLLDPL